LPPVTRSPALRPTNRPSTTSKHHTGKKEQRQDAGLFRVGSQQSFDEADRCEQSDGASDQRGKRHDALLKGHPRYPEIVSCKVIGKAIDLSWETTRSILSLNPDRPSRRHERTYESKFCRLFSP